MDILFAWHLSIFMWCKIMWNIFKFHMFIRLLHIPLTTIKYDLFSCFYPFHREHPWTPHVHVEVIEIVGFLLH